MIIYVVCGHIDYEDSVVLGVFSTYKNAMDFQNKYKELAKRPGTVIGYDSYFIVDTLLDKELEE